MFFLMTLVIQMNQSTTMVCNQERMGSSTIYKRIYKYRTYLSKNRMLIEVSAVKHETKHFFNVYFQGMSRKPQYYIKHEARI